MQPLLSNLKVLDLSRVLAGPWASQILADLGADVIKVERPGQGDDTRSWGPPFLKDEQGRDTADGAYFVATNRGKRSITLDLQTAEGQALVKQLCRDADVVLENYKVGTLARLGLDYASLSAINPRLVYCSVTGFGQTGPRAAEPAYDFLIQAMGGLMSVTGERDDKPGGGPQKVGVPIVDLTTGVYAAYEPYASVSVVGGTDSVEYTVNRFDQVLGTRVSGREQPPDSKIPRFVHIDKAVEHTVRQEAKEGESVSITVTSRSSGHAERLREHIDDRFRQSGDERNPPEVRVQPPQDAGNTPGENRQSESAEQA